jgi:hypothetical protein
MGTINLTKKHYHYISDSYSFMSQTVTKINNRLGFNFKKTKEYPVTKVQKDKNTKLYIIKIRNKTIKIYEKEGIKK